MGVQFNYQMSSVVKFCTSQLMQINKKFIFGMSFITLKLYPNEAFYFVQCASVAELLNKNRKLLHTTVMVFPLHLARMLQLKYSYCCVTSPSGCSHRALLNVVSLTLIYKAI